jgi:hypothetical protein
VQAGGFRLLIHDAEEATLAWQESQAETFPESHIRRILELRASLLAHQLASRHAAVPWARGSDSRLSGVVDLDGFLRLLRGLSTPPFEPLAGLTMNEAVTLFRAFREPGRQLLDLKLFDRALARSATSLGPPDHIAPAELAGRAGTR